MDVSVIIPTYNRASMVGDAIESALVQTHPASEVIVVDDGSTDDTERVVRAFGDRVRYVRQENRGVSAARNAGMGVAKGELFAFLDSDDLWYSYKLQLQVRVFEQWPGVGLVFSEFDILKPDGTRRSQGSRTWLADGGAVESCYSSRTQLCGELPPGVPPFDVFSGSIYRALLDEALVLTSTAVVRRGALAATDRFQEGVSIFEDWEFYSRVAGHEGAAFLDVATVANRSHEMPGRLTRCSQLSKAEAYASMIERVWKTDREFTASHPQEILRAEAFGLLAVARAAVLAGRPDLARSALGRWRTLGTQSRAGWAFLYSACARLPAGATVLRQVLRARTLMRVAAGNRHGGYSVNPAA